MTDMIEDICTEVPVCNDTEEKAISIYNNSRFSGLSSRIASILIASLIEREPVSINEYTSKYDISEEEIQSKLNLISIDNIS